MNQDKIWDYFQNSDLADVCFSKERQRYVVRLLKSGWRVLNVGVGSGGLEKIGVDRGIDMYSL
ncbi:MAG: hypothetical protein N3A65_10175, partial [candidate division WOR-3 bacterium]|nr:hypothetical protein [candidate division WOR-3 bacterium]